MCTSLELLGVDFFGSSFSDHVAHAFEEEGARNILALTQVIVQENSKSYKYRWPDTSHNTKRKIY